VVVVVFVGVVPTTLAPASFTAPIADDIARICDEGEEPPGGGVDALDEQVIDTEGSTAGVSAEAEAVETGALFGCWCTRRSLSSGGMTVLDVDREGGEEGSGGMSAHTKLARCSSDKVGCVCTLCTLCVRSSQVERNRPRGQTSGKSSWLGLAGTQAGTTKTRLCFVTDQQNPINTAFGI
jgi:hypothetical protein